MVFDVALSTMWAMGRFHRLADFFDAGKRLGFARFELNHAINSAMLEGLSLDGMIASVHEPCPADVSMSVLKERNWLVSAPDEENRRQGVAAIRRSIDLAHELGAGVVIVHPGRVDIDPGLESELVKPVSMPARPISPSMPRPRSGWWRRERPRQRPTCARCAAAWSSWPSMPPGWGCGWGWRTAITTQRSRCLTSSRICSSLDLGEVVGYWHDVGHAQMLENLGFGTHEEWLRRFGGPRGASSGSTCTTWWASPITWPPGWARSIGTWWPRYLPAGALRTCEFLSIQLAGRGGGRGQAAGTRVTDAIGV